MNPTSDAASNPSPSHAAAERGLASLLLGGILAVLAMLTLQINLTLFSHPGIWGTTDLDRLHYAAIAGAVVLGILCVVSLGLAVASLVSAYNRGQPTALGWAGLLISVLALLLWAGAIVDLLEVIEMLMRR